VKTCQFNERGVALILVIMIVSILTAVTLQMNRSSRTEVYDAANLSDRVRLLYVAKSGFNAGIGLLLADKNNFDALWEDWADAELIAAKSKTLFHDGYFNLPIEDESGKIQINRLVAGSAFNEDIKGLMMRLLMQPEFGLDEKKAGELLDAVKDWIDKDDETTGSGGAESAYYRTLDKPYAVKNGPLDCIEELLMIKGVTKSLYYGTSETPGLNRLLTVYGDGRININTAPKSVLRALSKDMDMEAVEKMDAYRRNKDNDLTHASWYQKIPGLADIPIDSRLITTTSSFFRIVSTGRLHQMSQTVSGVIVRGADRKKAKLLSWKIE
jgi:general secretion pathway protein K